MKDPRSSEPGKIPDIKNKFLLGKILLTCVFTEEVKVKKTFSIHKLFYFHKIKTAIPFNI